MGKEVGRVPRVSEASGAYEEAVAERYLRERRNQTARAVGRMLEIDGITSLTKNEQGEWKWRANNVGDQEEE